MDWFSSLSVLILIFLLSPSAYLIYGVQGLLFDGQELDSYDVILNKLRTVTGSNCYSKSKWELELPSETIAQIPTYKKLINSVIYSNRSQLSYLHNSAYSRAIYFSYIYGKLDKSNQFSNQPSLMHFYALSSSDVSSGWIHGSAILFDRNRAYPNWDFLIPFNRTLQLFGVRAWPRAGYSEPVDWLQEPAEQTVDGHMFSDNIDWNYTHPDYRFCPYTGYGGGFWWPDDSGYGWSYNFKYSVYSVGVRISNSSHSFTSVDFEPFHFNGPPSGGNPNYNEPPVLVTKPYFDCGRSNKWVVSIVSPVIEVMPRYTIWKHLQAPKVVAVIGRDIEFEEIDINPCPTSLGNELPNMFANTARCRSTTVCEPLSGFGFRRGGYQCACRAGLYYPWGQDGPFQGTDIEQATEEQYNNGSFDCVTEEELSNYTGATPTVTARLFETLDNSRWSTAQSIFQQKSAIDRQTCNNAKDLSQLHLPEEVAYGADTQFEAQGRTALKTAHFLSSFLQNAGELCDILTTMRKYRMYPEEREIAERINETHVFGEVIANVISDFKIAGFGVFFDRNKFKVNNESTRELFGPFAYRIPSNTSDAGEFKVIDFAGFPTSYVDQDWFKKTKENWTSNLDRLEEFSERLGYPNNHNTSFKDEYSERLGYTGTHNVSFKAPSYADGKWSRPMFKCDGRIMEWVVTYTVPFFGPVSSGTDVEFKGLVLVDVKLEGLDINQCPADGTVNNAFKNTAKCHYESQYCVPISGKGFSLGSYKCECRQGYVYPFTNITQFDGQIMEETYEKETNRQSYRNHTLECKKIIVVAAATHPPTPTDTSKFPPPPPDTPPSTSPSDTSATPDGSSSFPPTSPPRTTQRDTSASSRIFANASLFTIMATFLLLHRK